MNIKPIRTEQDYHDALKAIEPLFDTQPEMGTPEFDYMKVMVLRIDAYEEQHYPITSLLKV